MLLLVVSQTGLVYTFTTPKLEAIVKQPEAFLFDEPLSNLDAALRAGPVRRDHVLGIGGASV